jgi:hypothetical protein
MYRLQQHYLYAAWLEFTNVLCCLCADAWYDLVPYTLTAAQDEPLASFFKGLAPGLRSSDISPSSPGTT